MARRKLLNLVKTWVPIVFEPLLAWLGLRKLGDFVAGFAGAQSA